jgi:hypothetical protein
MVRSDIADQVSNHRVDDCLLKSIWILKATGLGLAATSIAVPAIVQSRPAIK